MKKIIPLVYILLLIIGSNAKAQTLQLWGLTYWGGLNGSGVIMHIDELDSAHYAFPYSFSTPTGEFPRGSLVYAKDSIFYGMTLFDGADSVGTLFSYDPLSGNYTDILDFDTANGAYPYGSLIQDTANGRVYGTTSSGGSHNFGVIFFYDPKTNQDSDIHDFDSIKGAAPYGKLLLANNGLMYGTTFLGGTNNEGVIFSFNAKTHNIINLYDFIDSTGSFPTGSLIAIKNKFYGLTTSGGAYGDGVIFSLDRQTNAYTDLYDFNYTNGANPYGSLVLASDSNLYGMAENGVDSASDGLIFRFNPDSNKFTNLFDFNGFNGSNPTGSLIQGQNGKLYGMTQAGGSFTDGVVFSLTIDSLIYTDIYDLNNAVGGNPWGDLVEADVLSGIAPHPLKNQFTLYPNPSKGLVNIISPVIINEVRVTDLYGRTIYTSVPNQNKLTIDIKDAGMYFVTLISDNQSTTQKIVISR